MRIKKHTNLSAFTLIELLVVLAIIGITAAILLTDWSGGRMSQQVKNAAEQVAAVVREAQNYALTGYQGVAGSAPYQFRVRWAGSDYFIDYFYNSGASLLSPFHQYALRDGVTFSGGGNFSFSVPRADVSFVGASQSIVLTKQGTSAVVCVYRGGRVETLPGIACP